MATAVVDCKLVAPTSLKAAHVYIVTPHGVALLFLAWSLAVASQCRRTRFLLDVAVCHLQSNVSQRPHISLGTDKPATCRLQAINSLQFLSSLWLSLMPVATGTGNVTTRLYRYSGPCRYP